MKDFMTHLLDPNVGGPEENFWHHEPLIVHPHLIDCVSALKTCFCCGFSMKVKKKRVRVEVRLSSKLGNKRMSLTGIA